MNSVRVGLRTILTIGAAVLCLALGCTRSTGDTARRQSDARRAVEAYLATSSDDRSKAFDPAIKSLKPLGRPGIEGMLRILASLNPSLVEYGAGPEWQENLCWGPLGHIQANPREALPVLLKHTRSDSGAMRAWAYVALLNLKDDLKCASARKALVRGLDDSYRVVREHAVTGLYQSGVPKRKILEHLRRMCVRIPDERSYVITAGAMGEIGDRAAIPFLRRLLGNWRRRMAQAVAINSLAKLKDWESEERFKDIALIDNSGDELMGNPAWAARWALAKKAGYDYPDTGYGAELADSWWRLVGRSKYTKEKPVELRFGKAVSGLALGGPAGEVKWPLGESWQDVTVVIKNVSSRPIRAEIVLGLGIDFKANAKVLSRGKAITWSSRAGSGVVYECELPPGGIVAPEFPIGEVFFSQHVFKAGDRITMCMTFDNRENTEKGWKGKLQAPPMVLVRR